MAGRLTGCTALAAVLAACTFDGSGLPVGGTDAAIVELIDCVADGPREGRIELIINRLSVVEASEQAPILVDLSLLPPGHELWTFAQNDDDLADTVDLAGADLVVTDADNERLPLEVAWFDPLTLKGELWFRGTLSRNADTTYYLYYGSREGTLVMSAANSTYGREAVWDSDYVGVWHLSELGPTFVSSTRNKLDGDAKNNGPDKSEDVPFGAFSQEFIADDDYHIDLGDKTAFDLVDSMTIEGWSKFASFDPRGDDLTTLLGKRDAYRIAVNGNGALSVFAGTEVTLGNNGEVMMNQWHHLAATLDNGLLRMLVDGVEVQQTNLAMDNSVESRDLLIGRFADNSNGHMNGWLDEVRVSMVPRTNDYLATQFAMTKDNAAFVTLGPHEACTGL